MGHHCELCPPFKKKNTKVLHSRGDHQPCFWEWVWNGWEEEANLGAGSETVFMLLLGGLMGCGQRGGKVAGWVRVKSCLLKGSCHQPPQPCSFTPAFQIHANLLRAVSTGALGNKGTGWFMQPVEAQALGPPGTLLQAREVSQKPPRAQPAESKDEA